MFKWQCLGTLIGCATTQTLGFKDGLFDFYYDAGQFSFGYDDGTNQISSTVIYSICELYQSSRNDY